MNPKTKTYTLSPFDDNSMKKIVGQVDNIVSPNDQEHIMDLAQGNPGAANALMHVYELLPKLNGALTGDEIFKTFLANNLLGPNVWILYKDKCKYRADVILGLVLAVKENWLSKEALLPKSMYRADVFNELTLDLIDAIMVRVREKYPAFQNLEKE